METPPVNPHHDPGIRQQRVRLLEGFDIFISESFSDRSGIRGMGNTLSLPFRQGGY